MGKYLPNMNKFCDWLSETKAISACLSLVLWKMISIVHCLLLS